MDNAQYFDSMEPIIEAWTPHCRLVTHVDPVRTLPRHVKYRLPFPSYYNLMHLFSNTALSPSLFSKDSNLRYSCFKGYFHGLSEGLAIFLIYHKD